MPWDSAKIRIPGNYSGFLTHFPKKTSCRNCSRPRNFAFLKTVFLNYFSCTGQNSLYPLDEECQVPGTNWKNLFVFPSQSFPAASALKFLARFKLRINYSQNIAGRQRKIMAAEILGKSVKKFIRRENIFHVTPPNPKKIVFFSSVLLAKIFFSGIVWKGTIFVYQSLRNFFHFRHVWRFYPFYPWKYPGK